MSNLLEDTQQLHKRLTTKTISAEEKGDCVARLSELDMTLAVLRSSKIGRVIAQLAKDNEPYSALAARTMATWKQLVPAAAEASEAETRTSARPKKVVSYKEPSEQDLLAAAHDKSAKDVQATMKQQPGGGKVKISPKRMPLPTRDKNGCYVFADFKDFSPNLSPEEVLRLGAFGGTYFRPIQSRVTGLAYGAEVVEEVQQWLERPFTEAETRRMLTRATYDARYGVCSLPPPPRAAYTVC